MAVNLDKITETYEALASGTSNAWEVYSGEQADAMAEENNIPTQKWLDDCAAMQAGQEIVVQELAKGKPQTAQEREARVRGVIFQQISGLLCGQNDDAARRGVLLHALQTASDFQLDDDRVAELSRLDLDALQNKVVDAAMKLTMHIALPVMQQKCQEAAKMVPDSEQQTRVFDNPGALAVAGYMEEPELRKIPVAAGACTGIVCGCYAGGISGDIDFISFGCLVVAGIIVTLALFTLASTAFAAVGTTLICEGTLAGIGGIVAAEVAFVSDVIKNMLLVALGFAAFGGLTLLLDEALGNELTGIYAGSISNGTGPIVSV